MAGVSEDLKEYRADAEPAYVYFLFSGEELIYIGITTGLRVRLNAHRNAEKRVFSRVFYVVAPSMIHAQIIEGHYIRRFKPTQNIRGGGSRGRSRVAELTDGAIASRESRANKKLEKLAHLLDPEILIASQ